VRAFAVSDAGTLVYMLRPGNAAAGSAGRTLVWVDRNGKEESIAASPNTYAHPNISPDGTRVALTDNKYIWIWDMRRSILTRITFKGTDFTPVWTPDGKRIAFGSIRREGNKNASGIYWKAADGTGEEEQLGSFDGYIFPYCWSSDGKTLIGAKSPDGMKFDIWMLSLDRDRVINPLLHEDYLETQPRISPDRRWISYTSNESGTTEVYVRPFPDVNKGRWLVSPTGGDTPLWSPNGHELFYFSGDTVMAISYTTEPNFSTIGSPQKLFQGPYACPTKNIGDSISWDISPDGKRFLMIKLPGETTPEKVIPQPKINIVLNWFEELKQRVPVHVQ
jgi:Tol biopolymer transport system component